MKYSNTKECISDRKKVDRMKGLLIWIAFALIMLVVAGCVSNLSDTTKNESVTTPAYTPVATDVTQPSTSIGEMQNVVIELPSSIKLQSLGAYSSSNAR